MEQLIISGVITVAIIGFVVWKQMRVKPIRDGLKLPLIVLIIGAYVGYHAIVSGAIHWQMWQWILWLGLFILSAGVLSVARAWTYRLWYDVEQAQIMQQGTWVTLILWAMSFGLVVLRGDFLPHADQLSYLMIGTLLLVQTICINWRAQRTFNL